MKPLDHILLALLAMHPKATGYDLHHVIEGSLSYYMLSAPLSRIYPSLKKLHEHGLVEYELEPIQNRPGRKRYEITEKGLDELNVWLEEPIENDLNIVPFQLKMAFSSLMKKTTILDHINKEISYRDSVIADSRSKDLVAYEFLNEETVDMAKIKVTWKPIAVLHYKIQACQLEWLKEWRSQIEKEFKD